MKNISLIFGFGLLLTGCAAMNEDDCMLADWQAIGYQTGVEGEGTSSFTQYQKDCSKYQIKADFNAFKLGHQQGVDDFCIQERGENDGAAGANFNTLCTRSRYPAYYKGYEVGLMRYCTYERGYSRGRQGVSVNQNCNKADFPEYFSGHTQGDKYYEISEKIKDYEGDLASLKKRIETIAKEVEQEESVLLSDASDQLVRQKALNAIKSYRKTHDKLVKEYYEVKEQLAIEKDRLERLSYRALAKTVI